MSDYDFSKLIPKCFKRKKSRSQVQRSGTGSVNIQSRGNIRINGKDISKDELEGYDFEADDKESRFSSGQLISIIGFVTLTACATILEASGGEGGGLWIVVVMWAMSLGNI